MKHSHVHHNSIPFNQLRVRHDIYAAEEFLLPGDNIAVAETV